MSRKKRFDDLMEAVTFAEAGEIDTARRIASDLFPEATERARILAVGGTSGFSRAMIDNALGMAERLEYALVALTVAPPITRLIARLGTRRRKGGVRSIDVFRAGAAERGIPFVHRVRRGDPERVVTDVTRTCRRIAFLLVEPELTSRARFDQVNVPIFFPADA